MLLAGPYKLSEEAIEWGEAWYETHYKRENSLSNDDRFGGYLARKQTHLHKLAMVLAASSRDQLTITVEDLATANIMITELESDMPKVFAKIGRTEQSIQAERFIKYVEKMGRLSYIDAYKFIHTHFPDSKDFEGILTGAMRAGYLRMDMDINGAFICARTYKPT